MTADRMATPARSVLLYADINLGAIGGASVWLATMAELLASAGCEVTLPLRGRRLPEMPLLRPLEDRPGIRIVEPSAKEDMSHRGMAVRLPAAVAMLKRLDARERFDVLVVRGMPLATLLAAEPQFQGRMWTYLTDIPQSVVAIDPAKLRGRWTPSPAHRRSCSARPRSCARTSSRSCRPTSVEPSCCPRSCRCCQRPTCRRATRHPAGRSASSIPASSRRSGIPSR